jgi:hypothetical protein
MDTSHDVLLNLEEVLQRFCLLGNEGSMFGSAFEFFLIVEGIYAWLIRPPSKRAIENRRLELEIKAAHIRTRGSFGPERLQKHLYPMVLKLVSLV